MTLRRSIVILHPILSTRSPHYSSELQPKWPATQHNQAQIYLLSMLSKLARVIVTDGSGVTGRATIAELLDAGHTILNLDLMLLDDGYLTMQPGTPSK